MRDYSKLSIEERKALNEEALKKLKEGAVSGLKNVGKGILKGVSAPAKALQKAGEFLKNKKKIKNKRTTSTGFMINRKNK